MGSEEEARDWRELYGQAKEGSELVRNRQFDKPTQIDRFAHSVRKIEAISGVPRTEVSKYIELAKMLYQYQHRTDEIRRFADFISGVQSAFGKLENPSK